MSKRTLIIYPDKETLAQAGAQHTLLAVLDALSGHPRRSRVDVALTGGSDALRALQYMAGNPLIGHIDFSRVHFWWADERFVAGDDEDRNGLQARRALLDGLVRKRLLPDANIHEMPADTRPPQDIAEAGDAATDALLKDAAASYERELIEQLGIEPSMDLLLLGMGPDGHYASLFPGHTEINVTDRLVVGVNHSPKLPPLRLSMTAPVLARSRRAWMLTAGAEKAEATAHVFAREHNPDYPASFASGTEELLWLTTPDAAATVI